MGRGFALCGIPHGQIPIREIVKFSVSYLDKIK
jgi:hypothetical protein